MSKATEIHNSSLLIFVMELTQPFIHLFGWSSTFLIMSITITLLLYTKVI